MDIMHFILAGVYTQILFLYTGSCRNLQPGLLYSMKLVTKQGPATKQRIKTISFEQVDSSYLSKLCSCRNETAGLEREIEKLRDDFRVHKSLVRNLRTEHYELQSKLNNMNAEHLEMTTKNIDMTNDVLKMTAEVLLSKSDNKDMRDLIYSLEKELLRVLNIEIETRDKVHNMKEEMQELKAFVDSKLLYQQSSKTVVGEKKAETHPQSSGSSNITPDTQEHNVNPDVSQPDNKPDKPTIRINSVIHHTAGQSHLKSTTPTAEPHKITTTTTRQPTPTTLKQTTVPPTVSRKPIKSECQPDYDPGVYTIGVNDKEISVYCDRNNSDGGWTVIQRRLNGTVDFYRSWAEYKRGFGQIDGEYWLGNDNIHNLSTQPGKTYRLWVSLQDWDGVWYSAVYANFSIEDESAKYKLHVSGYTGNAGDSMKYSDGGLFSTKDEDNDTNTYGSCAADIRKGGWWYKYCTLANLNGIYRDSSNYYDYSQMGVYWSEGPAKINGWYYSLKQIIMKVKPNS